MFEPVLAGLTALTAFAETTSVVDALAQSTASDDLDDWMASAIVAGMSLPVGLVAFKLGFDQYRQSSLVADTPTERIRSIAVGRTELKGVARPFERTYHQPFADGECVYARWRVQERREKNPHDDEDDEEEWKTVASGTLGEHLLVEDDTGAIVLESPSVDVSAGKTTIDEDANEPGLVGSVLGSEPDVPEFADFLREQGVSPTSEHRRRYEQWVVEEGTDLYVFGSASPREQGLAGDGEDALADESVLERLADAYDGFRDDLVMERDSASGEYIVSDRGEADVAKRGRLFTLGLLAAGIVFVTTGAVFFGLAATQYGLF